MAALFPVGILRESTGFKRNRLFRYDEYVDAFSALAPAAQQGASGRHI